MASKTNVSDYRFSIFINNDQARKSLIEMENVMRGYEAELQALVRENKKDTQEYRDKKKVYDDHIAKMTEMRKEAGLQALSLKELKGLRSQLNNELARAIPGSENRKKLANEYAAVNNRIKELEVGAKSSSLTMSRMDEGFNKYFAIITAVAASLTGLVFSFRKVVDTFNDFEKKLDNLSALTGLTGENLDWLGEEAKKMSIGMVEGNIRIVQSADAIVDAYTKVGSARPELLKNKESLNNVTKEAILLSEASNSELQPAVEALAGVLNQFNAPASDSRRIINALAAGSKEGAGEIPYLTEAIEKSGTVAADAGLSYEELVGTIETLAPRITQPMIAGRSLRAILLKLQEGANETNPAIVGMTTALDNLGKKNLSVTKLTEMFGIEHITAAKILINNVGEVKKYTAAVTGTNVALEQAAINTDNNTSKLAQAQNRVKLYSIELGEKLAPALTFSTNGFSYLMKAILASIEFFKEHRAGILATLAAVAAYTVVIYGVSTATKIWTAVTKLLDEAWKLFNTTMKLNPWGLIAAGIAAAATFLLSYKKTVDLTAISQQRLNDLKNSFNDKIADEKAGLDLLFNQLKKTNAASLERQNLIDTINSRYGTTLQNLKDEGKFLAQMNDTYKDLMINMQKKALLESKEDALKQAYKDRQAILDKVKKFDENAKAATGVEAINPVDPKVEKGFKYLKLAWASTSLGAKEYKTELDAINESIKSISDFSPQDMALLNQGTGETKIKPPHDPTEEEKKVMEYLKKIRQDLENARIQILKDEHEKELKLNELDLKRKLEDIKGNSKIENDLRTALKAAAKEKEDQINKKYADQEKSKAFETEKAKWEAIIQADDKGSAEWYLDAKEWLDKQFEYELSKTELTEQQKLDIKEKYHALAKKLDEDFAQTTPDKPQKNQNATPGSMLKRSEVGLTDESTWKEKRANLEAERDAELAIAGDNADQQKLIWTDFYKSLNDLNAEHVKSLATTAQSIVNSLSSMASKWSDYQNAIITKEETANNKQKDNLKKRLDSGLITQKQYDAKTAALDEDLNKKKRKAAHDTAVVQKAINLANAIINTAAAVVAATTAGPGVGLALAILTAAIDAIEVALIASTPIPEAAKGRYNVIGKDDGKKYNDVPYEKDPATGIYTKPTIIGETGQEIVINPADTRELQMNYPEVIQSIRYVHTGQRAGGSYDQVMTTTAGSLSAGVASQVQKTNDRLANALERFNNQAEKGFISVRSYDYERLEDAKLAQINNDVKK